MLRVVCVHAGTVILPELGEKAQRLSKKQLAERGVEIHVNTKVRTASDVWGRQQKKTNLGFLSTGETFGFIPLCSTHERRA
jgi:NADH dehydrogenase FAD-containing subunit